MNILKALSIALLFVTNVGWATSDPVDDSRYRAEALKILSSHGAQGKLTRTQLRDYLNDVAFTAIDADKDQVLQFIEYRDARLYCTRPDAARIDWACDMDPGKTAQQFAALANGEDLTAARLLERDTTTWGPIIEQQTEAFWHRAGGTNAGVLDVDDIACLLSQNAEIRAQSPATLLKANVATYRAAGNTVEEDVLESDVLIIGVRAADKNLSGNIDPLEFIKAFESPNVVADFNAFLNAMTPVSPFLRNDLLQRTHVESGIADNTITQLISQYSDLLKYAGEGAETSALAVTSVEAAVDDVLRLESMAKERKTVRNGPFGSAYVKDRGIVFPKSAVSYDLKSKTTQPKDGVTFVGVRVINDFTKAGSKATAGSLSWSKDAGSSPNPVISIAVRADWYIAGLDRLTSNGWRLRPALGMQYNRVGRGDDKSDTRKVFLLLDGHIGDGQGFLRMNHLQIGPIFEKDQVKRIDRIIGLIEWEPILSFPGFTTGTYYPISKKIRWYLRPRLAIELSNIREQPTTSTVTDSNFYRYGAEVGLQYGERTKLTYEYEQRHATNDTDEDYHFQTAQLEWQIDPIGIYQLTAGFSQGRDSPAFSRVEQYKLGFGIKF